MSEFATPGTYKQLSCDGRPCNTCGKCRDCYYMGDLTTWQWIQNSKNWSKNELYTWCSGQYLSHFKKRDGATCRGTAVDFTDPSTFTVPTSLIVLHRRAPPSVLTLSFCSCCYWCSYNPSAASAVAVAIPD
ncbi:unnamed protein product, partial [Rotaria sp. Silwood2]